MNQSLKPLGTTESTESQQSRWKEKIAMSTSSVTAVPMIRDSVLFLIITSYPSNGRMINRFDQLYISKSIYRYGLRYNRSFLYCWRVYECLRVLWSLRRCRQWSFIVFLSAKYKRNLSAGGKRYIKSSNLCYNFQFKQYTWMALTKLTNYRGAACRKTVHIDGI